MEDSSIQIATEDGETGEGDDVNYAYKQLWAGVLRAAVADIQHRKEASPVYIAAHLWMTAKDQHPGSFIWVCDVLGLNSASVLAKTLQLRGSKAKSAKTLPEGD